MVAPEKGLLCHCGNTGCLETVASAQAVINFHVLDARDGKVVCFFQDAQKFKARYATFGFNDSARLDEGAMWPVAFALKELTAAEEARIVALVKKAVS